MKNKKEEDEESKKDDDNEKDKVIKDTEPDENMTGYLNKTEQKMTGGEGLSNLVGNAFDTLGGGLKTGGGFILKNLSKAVAVDKLVKEVGVLAQEYFALKNGVLYWYQHRRSRKSKGVIIVKDIIALEINPKNRL